MVSIPKRLEEILGDVGVGLSKKRAMSKRGATGRGAAEAMATKLSGAGRPPTTLRSAERPKHH